MILQQMDRMGLIKLQPNSHGAMLMLNADAFDFQRHGGFVAQEELLLNNLQKLLLEIESLKPSLSRKVETITSIASGIATALGLFIK